MQKLPEGSAIVYCEGAFNTTNGKTAHGLVRRTRRYRVLSVVDSRYAGSDAGEVLDGIKNEIPVLDSIEAALKSSRQKANPASHLVVGLAPDGGRLSPAAREDIKRSIKYGLNVDCGLHDFLSEDLEIATLAGKKGIKIRDIRKTPSRHDLHFFSGKIGEVRSLKVAVLGTDSAIGKRTTAWVLVEALNQSGFKSEMIGTGQTAWLQGARYCLIMDSLINDFVAGEIEHAIWLAWTEENPSVIVIEGQGSLLNPAYPGGFEILAAGRPDLVILQHAPAREEYDGFPGFKLHPLEKQIKAIEMLSEKPVVVIAVNHENIPVTTIPSVCEQLSRETGLPVCDPLVQGPQELLKPIKAYLLQ